MTGTGIKPSCIHFILMGNAKEHITRAIDHFDIKEMVIFTSDDLYAENEPFIEEIKARGIVVMEVIKLRPFDDDALKEMTIEMLNAYQCHSRSNMINVIAALTGGTNLMVVAMSLFALLKGVKCHYIVKDDGQRIIEIGLLKELNRLDDVDEMEKYLSGERR